MEKVMSTLMMSSSGLRGIVGEHLTPDTITPFIRAFLKWCPKGKIIVGVEMLGSNIVRAKSITIII